MKNSNGVQSPLDPNQDLLVAIDTKQDKFVEVPYQELIGSLMYVSQNIRPDIAYAVGVLSRFNNNYTKTHWMAAKRVLRYLKQTMDWRLLFRKTDDELIAFCDSNWAGDITDYKSASGFVFLLGGGSISWQSKKHNTVAKSTTEAEYMSLSAGASEALWLKELYNELSPKQISYVTMFCDNKGAIDLSKNPLFHSRSWHIGVHHHFVHHHFVREKVISGELRVCKVNSEEMVADILTKALPRLANINCSKGLGLVSFEAKTG